MKYDLAVIGGGPGGYTAAAAAAAEGVNVVLFEKETLGGTCLNRGCMPTKALIHSAELFEQMNAAAVYGLSVENAGYDMEAIHARKNDIISQLCGGVEKMLKKTGVTVVSGEAHVTGPRTIECAGEIYEAESIIIAAGSETSVLPVPGADAPGVYTSRDLLERDGCARDFKSLIIIGGGVIGVEFASFYQPLGCDVTIIEAADRLLPGVDREISQRLAMFFKKRGIAVKAGTAVKEIKSSDGGVCVVCSGKDGAEESFTAEAVLMAAGRHAAADGIFTGAYAPEMIKGGIVADADGRTSLDGVYAIGDAVHGNIQLAHMAEAQAKNTAAFILGKEPPVDLDIVPVCIYAMPEIAYVGLSETEAKEKDIPVKCGKFLTGANGKSLVENAPSGYVKLVASASDGRILGAQLICPRATDLVAELAAAIKSRMTAAELAAVIHPHPTFSEMVRGAAETLI